MPDGTEVSGGRNLPGSGRRQKKDGSPDLTLCLAEAMQSEEGYQKILADELYNVFLKFIQVSRGGRGFTSLVFGMGRFVRRRNREKNRRTDECDRVQGASPASHGKRIHPAPASCPPGISAGVSEQEDPLNKY